MKSVSKFQFPQRNIILAGSLNANKSRSINDIYKKTVTVFNALPKDTNVVSRKNEDVGPLAVTENVRFEFLEKEIVQKPREASNQEFTS